MRPSTLFTAASAVTATLALVSGSTICTTEQSKASRTYERPECTLQVYSFRVCDDSCYEALKNEKAKAPDCVTTVGSNKTLATEATRYVNDCAKARADTDDEKYWPRPVAGLTKCTSDQRDGWKKKYDFDTPYGDCRRAVDDSCTSDCLAKLQEAVLKAPICGKDGFWIGESEKEYVWKCLKKRGEKVLTNEVMLKLPTADGTLKAVEISALAKAAAAAKTTDAPTGAEATTTKSPSAASTSSAVVATASMLAIGGSLTAVLVM